MKSEPFIRITKKSDTNNMTMIVVRCLAIVVAFIISGILIVLMGHNPFAVFSKMFFGPLSRSNPIQVIEQATSLIIISLGISLAFKMKFWNLGAEGQILFGAIGATFISRQFSTLPIYILLPLMFIASFIFGAFWGLIPGFFKAKFGTNETLFTLMMNYIALYIVYYLESTVWRDPTQPVNRIASLPENARIPSVFISKPWSRLNAAWILALILIVIITIYLKRTKSGYEISVVGESVNTARYAGMNVFKIIIRTMILSAGLCGIAGFIQVAGNNSSLSPAVTGNMGNTAIIIAWLSHLNPIAIFIVSILFSIMRVGGGLIEFIGIPPAASDMIQGIILFCVLGSEFFINYKVNFRSRNENKKVLVTNENILEEGDTTDGQ